MAKHTATLTSNTSVLLAEVLKPKFADAYVATIFAYGTYSSGTLTLSASPDKGVTKITLTDSNGNITATANKIINVLMGIPNTNSDKIQIYATLAGAGTPSITIDTFDNKG